MLLRRCKHFDTPEQRRVALTSAIAACVLFIAPIASAQRPPSTSWVHESWTARDGLPVNSINALLQTRDGYIWAATFDGLVRFDGVRFTVYNSANAPGLPSNRIVALFEARDGAIWLTTEQSQLVRFHRGRFERIGAE